MENIEAEFKMPSPKRMRVEAQHQVTKPTSNPQTPIDDMDDIYGNSANGTPASTEAQQEPMLLFEPPQKPKAMPPKFQLPGLGLPAEEGRSVENRSDEKPVDVDFESNGSGGGSIVQDTQEDHSAATRPQDPDQEPTARNSTASPPNEDFGTQPPADASIASAPELLRTVQTTSSEEVMEETSSQPSKAPYDVQAPELQQPVQTMDLERVMSETGSETNKAPDALQVTEKANALLTAGQGAIGPHSMDLDAEFEMDSSPIVSSSDSPSGSSSSDDSDDYQMLDPEEQARRLMQEDGGSDGEGAQDVGASKGPLRTLNEKPDEVVPKPNITITADMKIQELGNVENLVENLVLIKAKTSGEYQVLETGSVLCLNDRSVVGVVAETLGRVQQPYYSVRFTNAASIAEAGISKGTSIFYSEKHSTTVFTQPLKAYKGSDASNLHDEEVADDEIEFSDDEAEAEYKKRQKQMKQAKREGRPQAPDGFSRGPGGRGGNRGRGRGRGDRRGGKSSDHAGEPTSGGINYDDMDMDEPYTPLARPTNLHEMMGRNEAPSESQVRGFDAMRNDHDHSARGYDRGNEERGRGERNQGHRGARGDRRGRGGSDNSGYNAYPQNQQHHPLPQYPPAQPDPTSFSPAQTNPTSFYSSQNQYQGFNPFTYAQQHPGYQPMQSPSQQYGNNYQTSSNQRPYNYDQNQNPQNTVPGIPPGAFINPAFFAQAYQTQNYPPNSVSPGPNSQHGPMSPLNHSNSNGLISPGSNAAFLAAQERLKLLQNLARNTGGN